MVGFEVFFIVYVNKKYFNDGAYVVLSPAL